jgi:hypothetical protein
MLSLPAVYTVPSGRYSIDYFNALTCVKQFVRNAFDGKKGALPHSPSPLQAIDRRLVLWYILA